MDTFGDNLVNFYGSTEVSQASIATPEDLRAAPGTAGRVPRGAQVKILDDQGRELPQGEVGRIFVLGDNAADSADSREQLADPFEIGDLIGRPCAIFGPRGRLRALPRFSDTR